MGLSSCLLTFSCRCIASTSASVAVVALPQSSKDNDHPPQCQGCTADVTLGPSGTHLRCLDEHLLILPFPPLPLLRAESPVDGSRLLALHGAPCRQEQDICR
jgi:hypothetical protein